MRVALLSFGLLVSLSAIAVLRTVRFNVVPPAEMSPSPSTTSTVEEPVLPSENSNKLGASLRLRLSAPATEADARVNILLRTNDTLTAAQQAQLEALGAEVRTVAGDIVTVTVALQQVPAISELSFVSYIELSGTLRPEIP